MDKRGTKEPAPDNSLSLKNRAMSVGHQQAYLLTGGFAVSGNEHAASHSLGNQLTKEHSMQKEPAHSKRTDRLLRFPDVKAMCGLSRSWIYEAMEKGEFPRCIRLSIRAVAWKESEIQAWLESRQPIGGRR